MFRGLHYDASKQMHKRMVWWLMNGDLEGCCSNLIDVLSRKLAEEKTTKNFSRGKGYPGRDSNWAPPENESKYQVLICPFSLTEYVHSFAAGPMKTMSLHLNCLVIMILRKKSLQKSLSLFIKRYVWVVSNPAWYSCCPEFITRLWDWLTQIPCEFPQPSMP